MSIEEAMGILREMEETIAKLTVPEVESPRPQLRLIQGQPGPLTEPPPRIPPSGPQP